MAIQERELMLLSPTSDSVVTSIDVPVQSSLFPASRYMGSKRKLLGHIQSVIAPFNPESALDLFSGSGTVSYLLKSNGIRTVSNDYMHMSYVTTKSLIENNDVILTKKDINSLFKETKTDDFVSTTFKGLYFSDEDNHIIDLVRTNALSLDNEYKTNLALYSLIRSCLKKRPRGLFTYVGHRYDDGRNDVKMSIEEHVRAAADVINAAVFSNDKQNKSYCSDFKDISESVDLVYLDPPYFSPTSDNHYVRRYHFVEGIARGWKGVEIQENTITKKFKSYPTPFATREGTCQSLEYIFDKFSDSTIVLSYSSNSEPGLNELRNMMLSYKSHVDVKVIDYIYSSGTQTTADKCRSKAKEYLIVGY